jgi:hypothetical protein
MAARLAGQGALYAFEFACEAREAPLYVGSQWVGRGTAARRLSPLTPTALVFRQADTRAAGRLVNLCHAENAKAQAGGTLGAPNGPEAAVDGRYGAETSMSQFWAAAAQEGASPPAWIEVDLRRAHPVRRVEIYHAQSVGFSSHFNTAEFRVLGRRSESDWWSLLGEAKDNWSWRSAIDVAPARSLRFVRVEILRPNHMERNGTARIAEIVVWGDPAGA